jgi:hypothetical protein
MRDRVSGIARCVAPGPSPVKADAVLLVAREVLGLPVQNRTLPRLAAEIEERITRNAHRLTRSRAVGSPA